MRTTRNMIFAATALFCGLVEMLPAKADPAGWFLNVDPRGRAFLAWTPRAEGPRLLMLGCLRDAETFTTMSAVVGERETIPKARLRLTSGAAVFEAEGEVVFHPHTGRSAFISDLDAPDPVMRGVGERLLPVLFGGGDITVEVGPVAGAEGTRQAVLPLEGLAPHLKRFSDVCFH